jgi:hypothetical protein
VAKQPSHHKRQWTPAEVRKLKRLASESTPTRLIAHELGRTEDAVLSKARSLAVSLKPTNQSRPDRREG